MILDVAGVRSGYGRLTVLYDIDFRVDVGELVMLRGPNGAGKTTLLKTILGVLQARTGTISYRGKRVSHEPTHARFAAGISMAPEGRRIFSRLSVLENLMSGAYGIPKEDLAEQLDRVFTLFPVLGERRQQRGGSLSGGEQQMLAVGRALMSRPRLLAPGTVRSGAVGGGRRRVRLAGLERRRPGLRAEEGPHGGADRRRPWVESSGRGLKTELGGSTP